MVLLTWNGLQCQRKARFKKHKYSQKRSFAGQQTSISYTVFFKSPRNPKINKRSEVGFVARVFVCKGSLICEMSRRITTDFKIETQRPHSFFICFQESRKPSDSWDRVGFLCYQTQQRMRDLKAGYHARILAQKMICFLSSGKLRSRLEQ